MPNLTSKRDAAVAREIRRVKSVVHNGEVGMELAVRRAISSRAKLPWLLWSGFLAVMAPLAHGQVVTQFSYDPGDHVNQVTDPRGLVTSYTYDGLGQKWQQVSPDTGTTSFSFDTYGRVASMTRADGSQTTYGYDGISRRTSMSAGGLTQTFAYDSCTNGAGRLCSAADATGTSSYTYSPEGWITGRGFSIGGTAYSLGYSYNALGQVTAVVYPDGNQALYTYSYGVVSAVQVKVGSTVSNAATGITYQPNDLAMAQWTSSNGLVNTLSYDTDGRLTGVAVPGVQSLGLSYDAANRINGLTDGIDSVMTQDVGYDAMSRLTSIYSAADNEAFQYDANGNRTNQVLNGTSATVTPNTGNNQISSLSGGSNVSYGYDAKGNLTTVSGTPTFTYDAFNRLASASGSTYYVGPEGQRLRKTVSGTSTYFAPDSAGPLMAESQGGGWSDYLWLNGRLIGRINGSQVLAIHDDQVGRPEVMTDPSRAIVWRARNFAFDRTVTVANAVPLNLGFPGQYYDAESGLWNNGFRDYCPSCGRYIESDPLGLAAGINTYAYVESSPLMSEDPSGLSGCNMNLQSFSAAAYAGTLNADGTQRTSGGGHCVGAVKAAMKKGGGPVLPPLGSNGTPTNAAYGSTLTGSGCWVIVTDMAGYVPGQGDVAVTEGNGTGHIAVYDGHTWDADIATPSPVPSLHGSNYAGATPVIYQYVGPR